jgi:3',5'-nucleoside bisphosphate phosphatase
LILHRGDLHVHTVLSPCSDVEMIPPLIVQTAIDKGIDLLAITDHNATANIEAVQKAAKGTDLFILPGMELQTIEEVHVLCLFDTLDQVYAWQKIVDQSMPDLQNNIDFFGEQFVVDETGDFIRREDQMLLTSSTLTIQNAWEHVHQLGGLLIPAHVNRKAFGLIPVLGFVPTDIPIEILEISPNLKLDQAPILFPQTIGYSLIQNGDAHFLEDIRGVNEFSLEEPTMAEIRLAILNKEGRSHQILRLE